MNASEQLRLADICDHEMLEGAEFIGVQPHHSRPVTGVDLVLPGKVLDAPLRTGGVAVLALDASGEEHRGHLVDVMVRRASSAGSALLVLVGGPRPLPEATRSVAQHRSLALAVAPVTVASTELVVALRELVATPLQPLATLLVRLSRRLRQPPQRLEDLAAVVTEELPGANVFVCTGADALIAGRPRWVPAAAVVGHHVPAELLEPGYAAAVHPVVGLGGDTSLWLVAERERAGRRWLEAAAAALSLVAGPALGWLAREHVHLDRGTRMRSALLTEILENPAGGGAMVAEAARVGWQLEGWHTGLHFHFTPQATSSLTLRSVVQRLTPIGLTAGSFVERTDGWSAWVTTPRDPGPDHARTLARRLEDLLAGTDEVRVGVGVGSPQRDAPGISVTLAEARQAALIAATSTRPVAVRVLQEVGPSRLLLGWYSSDAFADYSRELLGPLLDSQEPEVLRTLEAYLERACSVSQTARALNVHRNTVAQRIAKAERLLGTTTATADARLALQLALRVTRAHPE